MEGDGNCLCPRSDEHPRCCPFDAVRVLGAILAGPGYICWGHRPKYLLKDVLTSVFQFSVPQADGDKNKSPLPIKEALSFSKYPGYNE